MDAEEAVEVFEGLGPVRTRRMFGAVGLFLDGLMFGLLSRGEVFLKADDSLGEGSRQFAYTRAGKPARLGYWTLPDDALDDPETACDLGRAAVARAVARAEARGI